MTRSSLPSRTVLVVLAALLALPLAHAEVVSPVEAKRRSRTSTRTLTNATEIRLPLSATTVVSADPYPSPIVVSGLQGTIRDVNVRLNTFTHTYPQDVPVLLVGPGGQAAILMARVGGMNDVSSVTLILDDEAGERLPVGAGATLVPGAFRPTAASTPIRFNAPAPEEARNTELSIFDGTAPNGTWRLFAQDEYGPADGGVFAGGWALEITAKVKGKKKRR